MLTHTKFKIKNAAFSLRENLFLFFVLLYVLNQTIND